MTGLIYVILIAVWGVVLVPRWLRHHDENRATEDSEALEAALSSEREFVEFDSEWHDSDEAGMAGRSQGDPRHNRAVTWREYLGGMVPVDYSRYTSHVKTPGTSLASTARRRRNILLALAVVFVASVVGLVVGVIPGSLVVLSTLLLGGYVSAMVFFMRSSATRRGKHFDRQRESAATATEREQGTSGLVVDGVRVVGSESDRWDPRETTLPTYVTKTKASKIPRRIDLTSGWTGADMVAQARERQASAVPQEQFAREWAAVEPDADADVERYANGNIADEGYYRRAVNE